MYFKYPNPVTILVIFNVFNLSNGVIIQLSNKPIENPVKILFNYCS